MFNRLRRWAIGRLDAAVEDLVRRRIAAGGSTTRVADDVLQQRVLAAVREEYTPLPRFAYHLPLDYELATLPPKFDPPVWIDGEELPLPPRAERHGEAGSDAEFLAWGKADRDDLFRYIGDALPSIDNLNVMDFGCSSGRILRHFYPETKTHGWKLTGVDVSARRIEWMRRHFPREIQVYTGSFLPILPFESNSFDVIYGMSVFTHIKYLWDMWLLEARRVLRPGGALIQSVHTERAWEFFARHGDETWVRDSLGPLVVQHAEMPDEFVYFGTLDKNQVFLKKHLVVEFWGRYFRDVKICPPTATTYQDWVVAIK
jgi:SAM-dependent methyltransferase